MYFYERDQDAARYAKYGLMGLRHRGVRLRYAALGEKGFAVSTFNAWSSDPAPPSGYAGVAAVEPAADMAVAGDGGSLVAAVDGGCSPGRVAGLVAEKGLGEAAEELVRSDWFAPCAAVVLTRDGGFLLARGRASRRPLSVGGYGFEALYAATETAPIALMGGSWRHDIGGGEALYGDRYVLERVVAGGERRTSLFEYVYMARTDSYVDGVSVYEFRREMGARLARVHGVEVDAVVGVPETALPYALGYAEAAGARLEHGFVSTIGRLRTAVSGLGHRERLMALSLKLSPVPSVFEARRVAVVDDSVVTGLTLKTVVQRLRRLHGAREIHVAVASPRLVRACPFRLQLLDEEALAARHLSDEEVKLVLDADSIAWLPLGEAVSWLAQRGVNPCTHCMG